MWEKVYYKSYKGFKWHWRKDRQKIAILDETALNKPKAYTTEYARRKKKGIRSRQFKNPLSAIAVITPKGNFCRIVEKRVEQIPLREKAQLLLELGINEVYCDNRSLGLTKFGIKTHLIKKRKNDLERKFGYKSAIHNFQKISRLAIAYILLRHMGFSSEDIIKAFHEIYLEKLFQII